MFNPWHEIKVVAKKMSEAVERERLKLKKPQPLSKIGLTLRKELTRANWLRVVYEAVIKDKDMPLSDEEVQALKQTLGNLLEGEAYLEEDLKILQLFLALRYSEASLESLLAGVNEERYRAVSHELLRIELSYFERFLDNPVVDVKLLNDQIVWIKRLFRLEWHDEGIDEEAPHETGIRDWIYRFVSLFLQRMSMLWGKQDLSYLLKRYGSEYLSFADKVTRLASHFPLVEEKNLRERLEAWYKKGAAYYEGKGLKSAKLTLEKRFSLTRQGKVSSDLKQWKKALKQVALVCERDYEHLREWARFASRSALVCFLGDTKAGLLAYRHFYTQLLEKQHALKEVLWGFRNQAEKRLRDLPDANAYLEALDLLDEQLLGFNEQLTDVSDKGLLAACFNLSKCIEHKPFSDEAAGLTVDKVRIFLTELSGFIATHQPLLDWLRHSCYCVANTERVISYEMNQRIKTLGERNASLNYEHLASVYSLTDEVLRQLSHLLQDKTDLLKLHADKNQILNELGDYGGRLVKDFGEEALTHIQSWQYGQWGSAAPAGTLQLTARGASDTPEENEDFPVIEKPARSINIAVLALKKQYIDRAKSGMPLSKYTRERVLIPPACLLYEGPNNESAREQWTLSTVICQGWSSYAKEVRRERVTLEKELEEIYADTAEMRASAAEMRASVARMYAEINQSHKIMTDLLLETGLSAVRKQPNRPSNQNELMGAVIDLIYSDPNNEGFLKILTKAGRTKEMFLQLLAELLEKESKLSKGKEESVDLLADGVASLRVSSSGEGLLEQEDKPNKKQEEATASPQEESLLPREAKRGSGSCSWQFFDSEAVQLTEVTDLFASLSVSSFSSNTP